MLSVQIIHQGCDLAPGNWSSGKVGINPFSGGDRSCLRSGFQPEEIIGKLRHADVLLGRGKKVA
jgi:hypothetical protein